MKKARISSEYQIVVGFFVGSMLLNWLIAPWVWPVAVLLCTILGFMISLSNQNNKLLAAFIGLFTGSIGCVFTLPRSSVHSFLLKENWSHVQMAPVLSIYSVIILTFGIIIFVRRILSAKVRSVG